MRTLPLGCSRVHAPPIAVATKIRRHVLGGTGKAKYIYLSWHHAIRILKSFFSNLVSPFKKYICHMDTLVIEIPNGRAWGPTRCSNVHLTEAGALDAEMNTESIQFPLQYA